MSSKQRKNKQSLLTEVMNERILFPGTMFLVTTRDFAFRWLKSQGWDESERGFGSLDYAVFSQKAIVSELSDETFRNSFLEQEKSSFSRL